MGAELSAWKSLAKAAQDYYDRNSDKILSQLFEEKAAEIQLALPRALAQDRIIWCRNGSVCREARPCNELVCMYKTSAEDMVSGCSRCQNFQVRAVSPKGRFDWSAAPLCDIYGKLV